MKREEELKYDDVVRMKTDRRNRKLNEKSHETESKSASSKSSRKKTKKFVFNQNLDYDDLDVYDEYVSRHRNSKHPRK